MVVGISPAHNFFLPLVKIRKFHSSKKFPNNILGCEYYLESVAAAAAIDGGAIPFL